MRPIPACTINLKSLACIHPDKQDSFRLPGPLDRGTPSPTSPACYISLSLTQNAITHLKQCVPVCCLPKLPWTCGKYTFSVGQQHAEALSHHKKRIYHCKSPAKLVPLTAIGPHVLDFPSPTLCNHPTLLVTLLLDRDLTGNGYLLSPPCLLYRPINLARLGQRDHD